MKHYGELRAVDGVELDIATGEFFTLLGPSGSGKTTTLRLIAGFELPDDGGVELGGADVPRLPPFDRDVNTVFQDYALFPHMTVGENVAYGLRDEGRQAGAPPARARRRSSWSGSPATGRASPPSSPAASASGSRSPARS